MTLLEGLNIFLDPINNSEMYIFYVLFLIFLSLIGNILYVTFTNRHRKYKNLIEMFNFNTEEDLKKEKTVIINDNIKMILSVSDFFYILNVSILVREHNTSEFVKVENRSLSGRDIDLFKVRKPWRKEIYATLKELYIPIHLEKMKEKQKRKEEKKRIQSLRDFYS